MIFSTILGAIIGGYTFRIRGGLLERYIKSTLVARLFWVFGACLVAILGLNHSDNAWGVQWYDLLFPLLIFVGCFPGWYNSLDLGRVEGSRWKDRAIMTIRGLWWTLPAGIFLWWFGYSWWWGLMGLCNPLVYEACWRWAPAPETEWAEYIFGAFLGSTLAVSLMV